MKSSCLVAAVASALFACGTSRTGAPAVVAAAPPHVDDVSAAQPPEAEPVHPDPPGEAEPDAKTIAASDDAPSRHE